MNTPTTNHDQALHSPIADYDDAASMATAARAIGMKPVRAWVPDEQAKARTNGARRTQLARAKAEQSGLKQLSVTLPIEIHPLVKMLALRTKAGESPELVLRELLPVVTPAPGVISARPRPSIRAMPRWKRWLLAKLLPADFFAGDASVGG